MAVVIIGAGLEAAKAELARCVKECGARDELLQGREAELAAHNLANATDDKARQHWLRCYRRSLRQVGGLILSYSLLQKVQYAIDLLMHTQVAGLCCSVSRLAGVPRQRGPVAEQPAHWCSVGSSDSARDAFGVLQSIAWLSHGVPHAHLYLLTARTKRCFLPPQTGAWPPFRLVSETYKLPSGREVITQGITVPPELAADCESASSEGMPPWTAVRCLQCAN